MRRGLRCSRIGNMGYNRRGKRHNVGARLWRAHAGAIGTPTRAADGETRDVVVGARLWRAHAGAIGTPTRAADGETRDVVVGARLWRAHAGAGGTPPRRR
ncbi:MAG: hypothetical protein KatS3mg058_3426 [Roseiflexus sp.]|nr:MAG: hypothetical protein KatS3mg058_3426 [Roseiflexus sp.]